MEVKPAFEQTAGDGLLDWRDCDISDLCQLQRGFDITEATRKPGNVPVYSSSGLSYYHNEAKLQPPAVITGRKGILGRVFFVNEPCWPHDTTLWVKDFKGNDPEFVSVFLTQFKLQRFDAATSVPTLNRNNLVGIPIRIPRLREQQAIAEALSDVCVLLNSLDRLITKKRDLKLSAMQQLLTGETRLAGFDCKWKEKPLGELFTFSGGYSASRDQLSAEGHCYLHYGDIHGSTKVTVDASADYEIIPKLDVSLSQVSSKSMLEDGDVVFVDASEDDEGASRHVVIANKENIPFISGLHTIVAKSKTDELTHEYRRYCFQTSVIRRQFLFYSVGTKVTGISKTNIGKVKLSFPCLREQRAIAEVLIDMDGELLALETRRKKTLDLKQAMTQELLTGKTRVV